MRRTRAAIIAFSGIDGAGKTTQISLLEEHFAQHSIPHRFCWSRVGYTPLFSALKRILRRGAGARLAPAGRSARRDRAMGRWWVRRIWLLASILDLMLLYGVQVRWWRFRGTTVICDRYVLDSQIDLVLNFPEDRVTASWSWRALERLAPRPDASFLMLVPLEESMRRCRAKKEPFSDSEDRVGARLGRYREWSSDFDYIVMDGRKSIPELFATVRETADRLTRQTAR